VLGESSMLITHAALVFALVALYVAQGEQSGLLGSVGMILSVIGTTLVTAVVFVQIAGASGMTVDAVLTRCVPGILNLIGGLSFFVGLIIVRHRDFASGRIPTLVGAALNRRGCRVRGGQLRRSSSSWAH
jgi:hypothetical protein